MTDSIKKVLLLVLAIVLAIVAVKFILWLLPVILIMVIAYFIYSRFSFKKEKKTYQKPKQKNKKIIIDVKED